MPRKTPDQDNGADELSLEHDTMPPPSRTRANGNRTTNYNETRSMSPYVNASNSNAGSSKKATTRSSSRTASPSPSDQPASSNLSRKRAAPTTVKSTPAKRGKPAPKLKLNPPKRVREDIYNEPDRLLGPKRSPIYNDSNNIIPAILLDQQTQQILATTEMGYRFKDVRYDVLTQACARFQTDGSEGRHDVDWLAEAWQAHHDRADGKFDEMNEAKFRENWVTGVESGEEYSDSEDESGVVGGEKGVAESVNDNDVVEEAEKVEQVRDGKVDNVEQEVEKEVVEKEVEKEEVEKEEVEKEVDNEVVNGTVKEGSTEYTKTEGVQAFTADVAEHVKVVDVKGVNADDTKDAEENVKPQEIQEARLNGETRNKITAACGEEVDLVESIEVENAGEKPNAVSDRKFVYISD